MWQNTLDVTSHIFGSYSCMIHKSSHNSHSFNKNKQIKNICILYIKWQNNLLCFLMCLRRWLMHDCTFRNKHGRDTFNSNIVTIGSITNCLIWWLALWILIINHSSNSNLVTRIQSDFLNFYSFLSSLSDHIGPPNCFNNCSNLEEL